MISIFFTILLLINNTFAISTFNLNNNLFAKYPFSSIGKIYEYNIVNCSITNKKYLCNSFAIDVNAVIIANSCISNYSNLYLHINKTEYKIDHILKPSNHSKAYDNWNILYLNETIIQNENMNKTVNSIETVFNPAYIYGMRYSNETNLQIRVCNTTNSKNLVIVTNNTIPKYYTAWNSPNHILYNKRNLSGEILLNMRKFTNNTTVNHAICMISYITANYSTCISIPYLSNINIKHHQNSLNMTNFSRFQVFHDQNTTKFDNNCNIITNANTQIENSAKYHQISHILAILSLIMALYF